MANDGRMIFPLLSLHFCPPHSLFLLKTKTHSLHLPELSLGRDGSFRPIFLQSPLSLHRIRVEEDGLTGVRALTTYHFPPFTTIHRPSNPPRGPLKVSLRVRYDGRHSSMLEVPPPCQGETSPSSLTFDSIFHLPTPSYFGRFGHILTFLGKTPSLLSLSCSVRGRQCSLRHLSPPPFFGK